MRRSAVRALRAVALRPIAALCLLSLLAPICSADPPTISPEILLHHGRVFPQDEQNYGDCGICFAKGQTVLTLQSHGEGLKLYLRGEQGELGDRNPRILGSGSDRKRISRYDLAPFDSVSWKAAFTYSTNWGRDQGVAIRQFDPETFQWRGLDLEVRAAATGVIRPRLLWTGEIYLACWIEADQRVHYRRLTRDLESLDSSPIASLPTSVWEIFDGSLDRLGGWLVAVDSGGRLRALPVGEDGLGTGAPILVALGASCPVIARVGERWLAAWVGYSGTVMCQWLDRKGPVGQVHYLDEEPTWAYPATLAASGGADAALLVWRSESGQRVVAQRVQAGGAPIGEPVVLADDAIWSMNMREETPRSIAADWSGSGWGVIWNEFQDPPVRGGDDGPLPPLLVRGRWLSAEGVPLGTAPEVIGVATEISWSGVSTEGRVARIWLRDDRDRFDLFSTTVDRGGIPVSPYEALSIPEVYDDGQRGGSGATNPEFRITSAGTHLGYNVGHSYDGDWHFYTSNTLHVDAVSGAGESPKVLRLQVDAVYNGLARAPTAWDIATRPDDRLVVCGRSPGGSDPVAEPPDAFAALYDSSDSDPRRHWMLGPAGVAASSPTTLALTDAYLVVWSEEREARRQLVGTWLSEDRPAGRVLGEQYFPEDGSQESAQFVIGPDGGLVLYRYRAPGAGETHLRVFTIDGLGVPNNTASAAMSAPGSFTRPVATWDGRNYLVAWQAADRPRGIYLNRVSPAGEVLDGQGLLLTASSSAAPAVASLGDGTALLTYDDKLRLITEPPVPVAPLLASARSVPGGCEVHWQFTGFEGATSVALYRRALPGPEADPGSPPDRYVEAETRPIAGDASAGVFVDRLADAGGWFAYVVRLQTAGGHGFWSTVAVAEAGAATIGRDWKFTGPAPSPARDQARLSFTLTRPAERAEVSICAVDGRRVRRLLLDAPSAGEHPLIWDGRDQAGLPAPSGWYIALLNVDGDTRHRRFLLLR